MSSSEKGKNESLSPKDEVVASRRNFLKAAGVVALSVAAPEILAAPEKN